MKLLRLFALLMIASFLGCGPGGPPPVVEPEGADPIDDVDVSLEEGLEAGDDDGAGGGGGDESVPDE